jgi:hypothetical protein
MKGRILQQRKGFRKNRPEQPREEGDILQRRFTVFEKFFEEKTCVVFVRRENTRPPSFLGGLVLLDRDL